MGVMTISLKEKTQNRFYQLNPTAFYLQDKPRTLYRRGASEQDELINDIFGGSDVEHGLSFFNQPEFQSLNLLSKIAITKNADGRIFIRCLKRQRELIAKPEEVVRQLFLAYVRDYLKYPLSQVSVEEPIQMGSNDAKRADVVVFTDETCTRKYIIFEIKKPEAETGVEQLHSYLNATGVAFGVWSNGRDITFQLREESPETKGEPYYYRDIPRVPKKGEVLDDVLKPLTKKDLRPIQNLRDTIKRLEDTVLANAGVNAFDELFKLIFAKLHDEFDPKKTDDSPMRFRVLKADPETLYERINGLFQEAKIRSHWQGIFDADEVLKLRDDALILCASALEPLRFHDADLDVIDAAFEYLINPEQKGAKGQYFTPRMVIDMAVAMMDPQVDEKVIDPACGSAGFLIHTIKHIREVQGWQNNHGEIYQYANEHIFAVDFDDKLKKVAKVMMLIAGDGKSNVFSVDSLDYRKWARSDAATRIGPFKRDIKDGDFDVVLTNPPFSGKISGKEQLSAFELYALRQSGALIDDEDDVSEKEENVKKKQNRQVNSMKRDVLFIERCLRFLKPGGRMAIVLPQGNLNNVGTKVLRDWIMQKARILGVVGLDDSTFKPFTGTKTSVLFLQKWGGSASKSGAEYPIFMATSRRSGKNNSGKYVPRLDAEGRWIDKEGKLLDRLKDKPVFDHDLNEIAAAYRAFRETGIAPNNNLGYVVSSRDIFWNERMDPEFFRPDVIQAVKKLKRAGALAIGDVCTFVQHGIQPPYVAKGEVSVVTQKEMTSAFLELEGVSDFTSISFYEENKEFQLRERDVLLYSVGAYIGRSNILHERIRGMVGSFVTILRANQELVLPEYLALFLNSPMGIMQSRQRMRGTAQHYLYPRDIKQILIYVPLDKKGEPDLAQQKLLAEKMMNASRARQEAKQQMREAANLMNGLLGAI
jgi:type I restriction enzyme M protein